MEPDIREDLIVMHQVSKTYGPIRALRELNFRIRKGGVHGFLGPNGAGKSTTLNILCGVLAPTSGKLNYFGEWVTPFPKKWRTRVGFLPEHPPLYKNMVVRDYLYFVCGIHGHHLHKKDYEKVISDCALESVEKRVIGKLSKGMRQRVGIASAIILDPDLIVLDEPMVGLDPVALSEIRNLIKTLGEQKTVLFSSHILHEVEILCDDLTFIHKGKVIKSGKANFIRDSFEKNKVFSLTISQELGVEELSRVINKNENFQVDVSYDLKSLESETSSRFNLSGIEMDQEKDLIKNLVANDIGVREFRQKHHSLEEIFEIIIKGEN